MNTQQLAADSRRIHDMIQRLPMIKGITQEEVKVKDVKQEEEMDEAEIIAKLNALRSEKKRLFALFGK